MFGRRGKDVFDRTMAALWELERRNHGSSPEFEKGGRLASHYCWLPGEVVSWSAAYSSASGRRCRLWRMLLCDPVLILITCDIVWVRTVPDRRGAQRCC